jgi:type IV secretory pathway TrbL component
VLADAANSPCPTAAATAATAAATTAATAAAATSATAAASTAASAASATAAAPAAAAASGQPLAQPRRARRFLVEDVKRPQADVRDLFFTESNLGRRSGITGRHVRGWDSGRGGCAARKRQRNADHTHHRYGFLTTPST